MFMITRVGSLARCAHPNNLPLALVPRTTSPKPQSPHMLFMFLLRKALSQWVRDVVISRDYANCDITS